VVAIRAVAVMTAGEMMMRQKCGLHPHVSV
jgi:hypothetical protein